MSAARTDQPAGRVVVVGSFNVDHVWAAPSLPRAGETLSGAYRGGPGGKGFNQAVAAARAGATTRFVCALGRDAGGQLARALAAGEGLDLRALDSHEPTGTAGIFVGADGANSIVIGPGANATLDSAFVDAQRGVFDAQTVALVQLECPVDAVARALDIAARQGATTILNPAPANVPVPAPVLEHVQVLTPNETEFVAMLARHGAAAVDEAEAASMTDAALHALCRTLLPQGTVVVTLGAAGCFVSHADASRRRDTQACYRLPGESVQAVDTTGAGDAFNGALAASLAGDRQAAFASHLRFANRFAALSTESPGAALAMPTRDAVERRFGT